MVLVAVGMLIGLLPLPDGVSLEPVVAFFGVTRLDARREPSR